jgi:hypothetical protein
LRLNDICITKSSSRVTKKKRKKGAGLVSGVDRATWASDLGSLLELGRSGMEISGSGSEVCGFGLRVSLGVDMREVYIRVVYTLKWYILWWYISGLT